MTSEVFDKFYSLILLLLPKLHVSILAGCDNEVRPAKVNRLSVKPMTCVSKRCGINSQPAVYKLQSVLLSLKADKKIVRVFITES